MRLSLIRAGTVLLLTVLAACGGGGGGDASRPETRVSIESSSLAESTGPVDTPHVRSLVITLDNLPAYGLYYDVVFGTSGITDVQAVYANPSRARLEVTFRPGGDLGDGSYHDTVTLTFCYDAQCQRPVTGSPLTVDTTLTVSSNAQATIDGTTVSSSATSVASAAPSASVTITTSGAAPAGDLYVVPVYDNTNGVAAVTSTVLSATQIRATFFFHPPGSKAATAYDDRITLRVCYDSACVREVGGSPFIVDAHYTISSDVQPEPGLAALDAASRSALPHDVIDAEFSTALNAVVMVSSWPDSALYIYDAATGSEKKLALNKPPLALSVRPDGLAAAVGHDGSVTHVDLPSVGSATPDVRLLDVTAPAGDLVLDGQGYVHVFPSAGLLPNLHTIRVADNTERLSYGPYGGTKARLHPSGNNIYAANNGLYPDNIENYAIADGTALRLGDSPYHGDYPMCGNLWFNADGSNVITACGRTFRTSTVRSEDMIYVGALPLSTALWGFRIRSLAVWAPAVELALIEEPWFECQNYASMPSACVSHLNFYESAFLTRRQVYSIGPVVLGSGSYAQQGLFVFYRNDGSKLLISRLRAMPNPAAEYYVSTLR